ncbi:Proteophosphoglycan ppg4 [Rhodotorula toruloides ATCC 204091]|uniref:Proteophosphoglycan ppg4 n=1 Tax=Rhodotorula toruloides TaxID=5286 RepID=A0A0K3CRV9_RHOTO|nr:Proteophosphoglycan ppg4 [Rhodotorula toruloides ATCC 204091]PRQ70083.1 Proteophosphoglycan ppg4 [Rhodotorula toruloides]
MAPQPADYGRLPPSAAAMSRSSTLDISVRSAEEGAGQAGAKEDVVPPLLSEQERGAGGGKAFLAGEVRRGSANGLSNGVGGPGGLTSEIRDSRRPSAASSTGTSSSTRSLGSVWRAIKSRATSGSTTASTPDSTPTASKIKAFFSSAGRQPTSASSPAIRDTTPKSVAMAKSASADSAPRARRRPASSAGGSAAGDRPKSFFDASTSSKPANGFGNGAPRLGAVQEGAHAINGSQQKWKNPFANARPATSAGSQTLPPPLSFARQPSSRAEPAINFDDTAPPPSQSAATKPPRRPSTATGATGAAGLGRALSFSTSKSTRSPSSPQDGAEEKTRRLPLRLKSIPSVPNLRPGSSRRREEEGREGQERPRVSRLPSLTGLVPAVETKAADSTSPTTSPASPPNPSAPPSSAPPAPHPAKKHIRQKSSITALTSILKHPSSSTNGSSATHDAADPLTDEELASWRLGRSRENSVGDAGVGVVKAGGTRRIGANGNGEDGAGQTANGSRRGSAEYNTDVLVIQKKQAAFAAPPSPPRPSAVPLSPSSPTLPFGSFRRPSAGLRRPKTAPENRPSRPRRSSDASSAFNVLEFVAADEGRDTKAALPMRFPQMNGDEAVFLPSAISPPMGSAPFPSSSGNRRKLFRRASSASSHLSLGSEEEMILSTLDGANLSHPSSPSSAGGSPVMFQSGFVSSGLPGAGESALPPSMRGLFATPGAPQRIRPRTAGGEIPLSVPSRRAAKLPPSPIKIPPTVPAVSASPPSTRPPSTTGTATPLRRPTSSATLRSPVSPKTPAPPRPPRAPSRPASMSPTSPTFAQHRSASKAWSRVSPAPSPSRAETPTRPARHPRRSVSIERDRTVAALEGRPARVSGESQRTASGARGVGREYTPPPSPPASEEVPVQIVVE